jgi:hypothetical protein
MNAAAKLDDFGRPAWIGLTFMSERGRPSEPPAAV